MTKYQGRTHSLTHSLTHSINANNSNKGNQARITNKNHKNKNKNENNNNNRSSSVERRNLPAASL